MEKLFYCLGLALALAGLAAQAATITVSPWTPVYKGVEHATGQQQATQAGERNVRVSCFRVDLTDPDIRLFTTPACSNCAPYETLAQNTSLFLEQYGLQAAINCNFYSSSTGPNDVPLGTPEDVQGLSICTGRVVSALLINDNTATLLFTTNNQPTYIATNWPATNTTGMFTGISGDYPLLSDGANLHDAMRVDYDPRTAFGISQDRRYLFLQTLDGRQPGWSDGENWYYTGEWLKRFGAWDAINVDGGGSTTMVLADCEGKSVRLNRPSFVAQYGRERIIGHNFGIYALPLPSEIKNLSVVPGSTTAILTWQTDFPADTQVEYGLTASYGNSTPLEPNLVRSHVATISGLIGGTSYYFRARSSDGGTNHELGCSFATTSSVVRTLVFGTTNAWKYATNNFDNTPTWKALTFDDSTWSGPSNAALHIESSNPVGYSFPPRSTVLPPGLGSPSIFRTYYFRTHFNFTGSSIGLSLTFSNNVDDGAVFYLNGAELQRLRMPAAPTPISNATSASGSPCQGQLLAGDALTICPDVFTIGGNLMTNIAQGDNVIAVEVHNLATGADILFASALFANLPGATQPRLFIKVESGTSTIYWNGQGFTLQQSSDLSSDGNWTDVPGPVTQSPFSVPILDSVFYRLRN